MQSSLKITNQLTVICCSSSYIFAVSEGLLLVSAGKYASYTVRADWMLIYCGKITSHCLATD